LPNGSFKASAASGASEAIATLEMGPELYNTVDIIQRRNHDINDIINNGNGTQYGFTKYDPQGDFKEKRRTYEDLSTWEKVKCNFWGTCPPSRNR
jgi:hypothetical protein